jgi:hypothetical protein
MQPEGKWSKISAITSIFSVVVSILALGGIVIAYFQFKGQNEADEKQFALDAIKFEQQRYNDSIRNKRDKIELENNSKILKTFVDYFGGQTRKEQIENAPFIYFKSIACENDSVGNKTTIRFQYENSGGRNCMDLVFEICLINADDMEKGEHSNNNIRFLTDTIGNIAGKESFSYSCTFNNPFEKYYVTFSPLYTDYISGKRIEDYWWIYRMLNFESTLWEITPTSVIYEQINSYYKKHLKNKKDERKKYKYNDTPEKYIFPSPQSLAAPKNPQLKYLNRYMTQPWQIQK